MRRSQIITSPDGDRWQVRRRWLDRPVPKIRKSLPATNDEIALEGGLEALSAGVGDNIPLAIGVSIAVALLIFFLLPLIGVALEIVLLLMLLSSGHRRPSAAAAPVDDRSGQPRPPQRSATFAVKGWRRSSQVIDELFRTIPASGVPPQIPEAHRTPANCR